MSKILIVFMGAIIAVLLLTGMVEVKIQPGKYTQLTKLTNTLTKEKSTWEKGRAFSVGVKRKAELFIVQDKEKRLVLSLLYVKTDAQRLTELIEKEASPEALLPQAEMLVDSIEQVKTTAEKAPVEVVASMKSESEESFTVARKALGGLQEQYDQYEEIHGDFTKLTKSLEEQIGKLGLEDNSSRSPETAGASDEN